MPQYGPFTRGATIKFDLQFLDAEGDPISPVSSEIHINYQKANGERGDHMSAMMQAANNWLYEWDSQDAEPGIVHVYAHTSLEYLPVSAINIRFELLSNKANKMAKIADAA